MTEAGSVLVLRGMLTDQDLGGRLGDLDLAVSTVQAEAPFRALDDFTGSLRASGRVLVQSGQDLTLLDPDEGVTSQDAARPGDFVADLQPGPVKAALRGTPPLRSLLPDGSGTISQRQIALTDDEGKTHARALLATLTPEGPGAALTLAALQGLRGYDDALEALRDRLSAAADAAPEGLGATLFPDHQDYVAKPDIPLAEQDPAWQVANRIILTYLRVARRNEAGIIADHDTEFLHDYRVALRKVRSVLSLFKGVYSEAETAVLKRSASALMAPTGRLRDLDVYLLARDEYFAMLPPSLHPGLELMFTIFAQDRKRQHRRLAARLQGAAHGRAMDDLLAILEDPDRPERGPVADQPAGDYARRLIWKRYRKTCRIARAITARTPDAQIHELRIACKKLRYLIEFFAPLFPAKTMKPVLKPLKRLQDNLGLFNDYSVQQTALRDFMETHAPLEHRQDLALAQSIGALIAVLHDRQKAERARIIENFDRFDSAEVRADIRMLFHGKEV